MTSQEKKSTFTFEEHLEFEQESQQRGEYHSGEVYAMAGGSKRHNTLALNTALLLRGVTLSKSCKVFISL